MDVGVKGGSVDRAARIILDSYGIGYGGVTPVFGLPDTLDRFRDGTLDARFFYSAFTHPTIDSISKELDVRVLPHGQRHEIIFARLDGLAPGEALVIVNDHDPKPLRYQTSALWPDRFEWTYREEGPQVWRVAITRVG